MLIHGMHSTSEYYTWQGMKQRCFNTNSKRYKQYGGRGITVCARWVKSFLAFYQDMGARPEGKTLDRINNDGSYSKANCRWATRKEQDTNTTRTRMITYKGETLCPVDWSRKLGPSSNLVFYRLKAGWSDQDAVSVPVGERLGNSQVTSAAENARS